MLTGKKVKDKNFRYVEFHWTFSTRLSYVNAQTVRFVLKCTSVGFSIRNV